VAGHEPVGRLQVAAIARLFGERSGLYVSRSHSQIAPMAGRQCWQRYQRFNTMVLLQISQAQDRDVSELDDKDGLLVAYGLKAACSSAWTTAALLWRSPGHVQGLHEFRSTRTVSCRSWSKMRQVVPNSRVRVWSL